MDCNIHWMLMVGVIVTIDILHDLMVVPEGTRAAHALACRCFSLSQQARIHCNLKGLEKIMSALSSIQSLVTERLEEESCRRLASEEAKDISD